MNATSSWEKQARALEDAVAARPAPEAALPEYLRALDTVRRETMAAQPDDYLRQEAGILFEQAKQAGQLMTAVAAPKEEARPARKEKQLLSLVGMVAGFLACAAALLQGEWLIAALALVAALALFLPVFSQRREEQKRAQARAEVRPERLVAEGTQMMRRIDGYMADFGALNRQIAGQAGGCDRNALALCQELWESRGEGPDADNLIADKSIEYLLTRNGCEMHLYDGAHAREFSTLPSRSENRTIRPAIVERGTGTLVLRGLAAVREEDA